VASPGESLPEASLVDGPFIANAVRFDDGNGIDGDSRNIAKSAAIHNKIPMDKIVVPAWPLDGRWKKWIKELQNNIDTYAPRTDDLVWNIVARCWDYRTGNLAADL